MDSVSELTGNNSDFRMTSPEKSRSRKLTTDFSELVPEDDLSQVTVRARAQTAPARDIGESTEASSTDGAAKPSFMCASVSLDWSSSAVDGRHLWLDTDSIKHHCYICGDSRASSSKGCIRKCIACKIVAHHQCAEELKNINLSCRQTYRIHTNSKDGEHCQTRHHWVNQRKPGGKCHACGKSFQGKFAFSSVSAKEFVAVGCSWCKQLYHNNCFRFQYISEPCQLGEFSSLIVPPSWVTQLPAIEREGSKKKGGKKAERRRSKKTGKEQRFFAIQPQKAAHKRPLLVFVNPKSGGNQGAKLLAKFLWMLNPRQVFNLLDGGPNYALRLYSRVPRLRILVCGGDGTVGWILSVIDELKIRPCPPVAILPIGTGNDLARTLGWGGGYTDDPLDRILHQVNEAAVVQFDRWDLLSTAESASASVDDREESTGVVADKPPLSVMNNYFSIGADALVSLEFHESREANPERFNSRFFNKVFYAGAGGKEILERKLRDLSKHLQVIADGVDITPRIRETKLTAIVFINISRYSAGTQPWGVPSSSDEFRPTSYEDGFFEVIGFTTMMMAALQMGSHGIRLAQCRRAELTTTRPLPVQVDGEPCRLCPSTITISLRNQVCMLQRMKRKSGFSSSSAVSAVGDLVQSFQDEYDCGYGDGMRGMSVSPQPHPVSPPVESSVRHPRSRSANNSPLSSPSPSRRDVSMIMACSSDSRIEVVQSVSSHMLTPCSQLGFVGGSAVTPSSGSSSSDTSMLSSASIVDSQQSNSALGTQLTDANLQLRLSKACKQGELDTIKHLLSLGASCSFLDDEGMTALHHASRHNRKLIVHFLARQMSPKELDIGDVTQGQTALHKAACYGYREICQVLVEAGASLVIQDTNGDTPYLLSLGEGDKQLQGFLAACEQRQMIREDKAETAV